MGENVIKAICGTNVNWGQAVKMINRIGQLGPTIPNFANLNAWPTPRQILRAGKTYLTERCRVGYRADSILAFCENVRDGSIDPESLIEEAAKVAKPAKPRKGLIYSHCNGFPHTEGIEAERHAVDGALREDEIRPGLPCSSLHLEQGFFRVPRGSE